MNGPAVTGCEADSSVRTKTAEAAAAGDGGAAGGGARVIVLHPQRMAAMAENARLLGQFNLYNG